MAAVLIFTAPGCTRLDSVVQRVYDSAERDTTHVAVIASEEMLAALRPEPGHKPRSMPVLQLVDHASTLPEEIPQQIYITSPNPVALSPTVMDRVRTILDGWAGIWMVLASLDACAALPIWLTAADAVVVLATTETPAGLAELAAQCRERGIPAPILLLEQDGDVNPAREPASAAAGPATSAIVPAATDRRQELRERTAEALQANHKPERAELDDTLANLREAADRLDANRQQIGKVEQHLDRVVDEVRLLLWERRGGKDQLRSLTDEAWDLSEHRAQLQHEREGLRKQAEQDVLNVDRIIKGLST